MVIRYIVHILNYKKIVLFAQSFLCYTFIVGCVIMKETINNLRDDYTIVIIAHRLSTIKNCYKIFFMENGKIKNSGSHDSLIKKCKEYKNLYNYEIKEAN